MQASKVACPRCRASLRSAEPLAAGKSVTCPRCRVKFSVPAGNGDASAYTEAPRAGIVAAAVADTAVTSAPPSRHAAPAYAEPPSAAGVSPVWLVLGFVVFLGIGAGLIYWCFFTGTPADDT